MIPTLTISHDAASGLRLSIVAEGFREAAVAFRHSEFGRLDHLAERILRDFARREVEIEPELHGDLLVISADQLLHWTRHLIVSRRSQCSVCEREWQADRKAVRKAEELRRGASIRVCESEPAGGGGEVKVRRIALGVSGLAPRAKPTRRPSIDTPMAKRNAESLGF